MADPLDRNEEDFLGTARRRFSFCAEEEKHLRDKFVDDLRFASPDGDEQWDEQVKQQREQAGRPAMSFPRGHVYVQQVSNQARQNKPQIKFAPRLDATKDTAEVYEGLARYIQYDSSAQTAYENAIEYSAGASFGYYRITTDFVDDDEYWERPADEHPQEIKVLPIYDPLTVYGVLVPACFGREPDYWFVIEDIPKEEFKRQYPNSQAVSMGWTEAARQAEGWFADETIRIAEYWYVEEEKVKGRRKPKRTIKFCKINGLEVLPETDTVWAGSKCPIIPVLGKQMIQEGKPRLFSVVRPQKSSQQMLNYSKTRIAETLSIAPVSPFLAVEGQLEGHEAQWQSMNKVLTPVLFYKATDVNGQPVPAPQRQVYEPPIAALSNFVAQEVEDMKATSGIFDASLGNRSNETSGKAILSRQQQSDLNTMHYLDNLERSFRKAGNIIAELIPKIYDTAREIQILGEDEAPKIIKINQPHTDENGKPVHYDMSAGKYDIVVTMGRAYSTKRMESFDMMQQIVQSAPQMLPIFGDILFKNSDMAGADIVSERFKKMLPPNLQDEQDGQPQIPPQVQQQMQQVGQQNQALNAACQQYEKQIQDLQFQIKAKTVDHQGQLEIERMRAATALSVAQINASKDSEEAFARAEMAKYKILGDMAKEQHKSAHDLGMQAAQHAHEDQVRSEMQQQAEQPESEPVAQ